MERQGHDKPRPGLAGALCRIRAFKVVLASMASVIGVSGCAPRATEFYITDHRRSGPPQQYFERFDECYFAVDQDGHVDIVARRQTAQHQTQAEPFTQVLHLKEVWSAIPGRTYAEDSMINATIDYLVVGRVNGAGFGGGGFFTFTYNRDRDEIRGELESSALTLQRRLGNDQGLFERAEVVGRFRARRDKRQVVRILNEMDRLFGPLPRYQPPPGNPNLR